MPAPVGNAHRGSQNNLQRRIYLSKLHELASQCMKPSCQKDWIQECHSCFVYPEDSPPAGLYWWLQEEEADYLVWCLQVLNPHLQRKLLAIVFSVNNINCNLYFS